MDKSGSLLALLLSLGVGVVFLILSQGTTPDKSDFVNSTSNTMLFPTQNTSKQLNLVQQEDEQKRKNFLFEKQTECKNICEKLYLKDIRELSDSSVFNPRYAYNEDQNACFYSGGWLEKDFSTARVLNCQTNEEVLTYMTLNGKPQTGWGDPFVDSRLEYNNKERILMGY